MPQKNHLSDSSSPYLLQHVNNPVDWYPWGEEALAKAKREKKPILLSIGYSACHWCHVMAHESFEDEATAKLMNDHFINIKVDREERPDLDKIYQLAHQLLTNQAGGWPLTVFLTPQDQMPFYTGTYFPPEAKYGIPDFKTVLSKIAAYYADHRPDIDTQNIQLRIALAQLQKTLNSENIYFTNQPLSLAREQLENDYDNLYGGFGLAPKFPHPLQLLFLMQHYQQYPEDHAAFEMVKHTLNQMSNGGIYDQLGGGFFRYSVDQEWQIPHFEKMLYDNALLLSVYIAGFRLTQDNQHAQTAIEIAEWVLREMIASPASRLSAGYFATLDADSEGHEGKYYYWDREQIRALLPDEEYALITKIYSLDQTPNFENHWHLRIVRPLTEVASQLNMSEAAAKKTFTAAKQRLLLARAQRRYPHRDEKILTSWNALMIKALLEAGYYLKRDDFTQSALNTLNFIHQHCWVNKTLFASYKDGQAYLQGYLDDYAFLLDALLTALQFDWQENHLNFAIAIADIVITEFYDEVHGGFFFTKHNHETLITRPKSFMDEATPSGNSVAAFALNRLGHLLGETKYLQAAQNTLKTIWPMLGRYPKEFASSLLALKEIIEPPELIILRGKNAKLKSWQRDCLAGFNPHRLCLAIPAEEKNLPGNLKNYQPTTANVTAYICKGIQCLPAITSLNELRKIVKIDS